MRVEKGKWGGGLGFWGEAEGSLLETGGSFCGTGRLCWVERGGWGGEVTVMEGSLGW